MTQEQALIKLKSLIDNPQPNEAYSLEYNGESGEWLVVIKINSTNSNDNKTN